MHQCMRDMSNGWSGMDEYTRTTMKGRNVSIFSNKMWHTESFNSAKDKPYKLGVNQFADLTNEEFIASRNRFKGSYVFQHGYYFQI